MQVISSNRLGCLALMVSAFFAPAATFGVSSNIGHQAPLQLTNVDLSFSPQSLATKKVDVTLGVMSKCPDALACEAVFDKVLERVNDKTRLQMTYIGTPVPVTNHTKYGVECKHGDSECLGNIQQLCVQDALNPERAGQQYHLSPSAAQQKWWSFIQCQNDAGLSNIGDEDLARQCLKRIDGPDWDKDGIAHCIKGKKGVRLLHQSVVQTKTLDVTKSCTILIEGRIQCVHDGGQWVDCEIGHEVADFVGHIEKKWSEKNPDLTGAATLTHTNPANLQGHASPTLKQTAPRLAKRQVPSSSSLPPSPSSTNRTGGIFGGQRTPPTVFTAFAHIWPSSMSFARGVWTALCTQSPRQTWSERPNSRTKLNKRQSLPGSSYEGPTLPTPFLAFAITAIALFVLVVGFVLLRIVVRNRRLRQLGLLPDGAMDSIMGNFREIQDTLTPPKLLEAKIAYENVAEKADLDGKTKGWDGVMPISAALPPNLYADLLPSDLKEKSKSTGNELSYPPLQGGFRSNAISRHVHIPSFLRRSEAGINDESDHHTERIEGQGDQGSTEKANANESTPASVNITVLITMPSPRTVFPTHLSAKKSHNNLNMIKSQSSMSFNPLAKPINPTLDEVEENEEEGRSKLRRTSSIKSFRTVASGKSVAEARREAFFGSKATQDAEDESRIAHATNLADFEDEEELPELVFGTASVPIFCRNPDNGLNPSGTTKQAFSGTSNAFHPLRSELISLITEAHDARNRKAEVEAAMKEAAAQKEALNGDDGQTTIDERYANPVPTSSAAAGRLSASETIDSEAGPNLSVLRATRADGLGDVVSRMIDRAPQADAATSEIGTASRISSSVQGAGIDPRNSLGVASSLTDEVPNTHRTNTPVVGGDRNGSTLTLDPLLGQSTQPYPNAQRSNTTTTT